MTLHPLSSKGGAFVLKLGLVFKRKDHLWLVFSFAMMGFEPFRMQHAGGMLLSPVQKLMATIIFAKGKNANQIPPSPNSETEGMIIFSLPVPKFGAFALRCCRSSHACGAGGNCCNP